MLRQTSLLAVLLCSSWACSVNLGLDGVTVACEGDEDCTAPQQCNPFTLLCASADNLGPPPTPGIVLTSNTGLETTEAGTTATFGVTLAAEPAGPVSISLRSSDPLEGFVAPDVLTFGPFDWNRTQLVTVTGADDVVADGDSEYSILLLPAISEDLGYQGLDGPDVTVVNRDDDVASILVTPTEGLVVNESGASSTFTVVATSRPASTVTIPVQSGNLAEATVTPGSVLIDPAAWFTPVQVTVQGVDDSPPVPDGAQVVQLALGPTQSTDPAYDGLTVDSVSVSNQDNDQPGFTVNPLAGLVTNEVGGQASFTVVLNTQPSNSVTVAVTSSDTSEGTADASELVFDDTNWDVAQTVTITGVPDAVPTADGPQAFEVVLSAAVSSDASYNGLVPQNPAVVNADTDVAAVQVSGQTTAVENGPSITIDFTLATQPASNVTLSISPMPTTELMLGQTEVTFTPGDWKFAHGVSAAAINDDLLDGDTVINLAITVSSADPMYDALSVADVQIAVADNDRFVIPLEIGTIQSEFASLLEIDALCNAAAVMGTIPSGQYKAMMGAAGRRATMTPNLGDNQLDWVLHEDVTYYNANLELIETVGSSRLFTFPLSNPLYPGSPGASLATGLFQNWTTILGCGGDWSNAAAGSTLAGERGALDATAISTNNISCAGILTALCVGQ